MKAHDDLDKLLKKTLNPISKKKYLIDAK